MPEMYKHFMLYPEIGYLTDAQILAWAKDLALPTDPDSVGKDVWEARSFLEDLGVVTFMSPAHAQKQFKA